MTTSRFSVALLAGFGAACWGGSVSNDGRPPANTELGRIVRTPKFEDAAAGLQRFAELRLEDRTALRREFEKAGFQRSVYADGPDNTECEKFNLTTTEAWPSVYAVDICAGKVFANAGQQAP